MATTKIRSNVYLDKELKEKAKEIFEKYGLSLSDGINILLSRVVKNEELITPKEFDIEPVFEDDPDYEIIKKAREYHKKYPEEYVDFNDIDWD
jgi:addiction module RelB/DinJ family antitoxin